MDERPFFARALKATVKAPQHAEVCRDVDLFQVGLTGAVLPGV
jgi:hypothetical protein